MLAVAISHLKTFTILAESLTKKRLEMLTQLPEKKEMRRHGDTFWYEQ